MNSQTDPSLKDATPELAIQYRLTFWQRVAAEYKNSCMNIELEKEETAIFVF